MRLACTLWFLGNPVGAARARDAALALSEEIGHPYSRALTLVFATLLALEMRDTARVRAFASELLGSEVEVAAGHIRATFDVFASYVEVLDGRIEQGIARIASTIDDSGTAEQAPGQVAFFLRVLLEACALAPDAGTGLAAADRLRTESQGVRLWEAEAHRFRAQFLNAQGAPPVAVEAELHAALAVARSQGAKLFELRAATSLLRLHVERGDHQTTDARAALIAIIERLPESQDTIDVLEAVNLARN
jgi:hypothetical protein